MNEENLMVLTTNEKWKLQKQIEQIQNELKKETVDVFDIYVTGNRIRNMCARKLNTGSFEEIKSK